MVGNFIGNIVSSQAGNFFLIFILIFALIFGILERIQIFKKREFHAIISIAIALISSSSSLIFPCVSAIFSKLAIALAVILVVSIIIHLSIDSEKWKKYMIGVIAMISIVVIIFSSLGSCGIVLPKIEDLSWIIPSILGIIVIGAIIWVVSGQKQKGGLEGDYSVDSGDEGMDEDIY